MANSQSKQKIVSRLSQITIENNPFESKRKSSNSVAEKKQINSGRGKFKHLVHPSARLAEIRQNMANPSIVKHIQNKTFKRKSLGKVDSKGDNFFSTNMTFHQTGNINHDMRQRPDLNNTVQSLLPKQIEITAT